MTTSRHQHDDHDQWDELAVGYALSALEPDELDRFVQHLVDRCAQCSRSVSDTNLVGAGLAAALPVPEPRPSLRADVLAAALAARPAVPQTTADLPGPSSPERGRVASMDLASMDLASMESASSTRPRSSGDLAGGRSDELAVRRARRLNPARVGWVLAAAAAVVAVVMSAVTVSALHSRDRQQSVAAARQNVIDAITADGSGRVVSLRADGGAAMATVIAHKQSVTVYPEAMPANSKTTSYVLWGIASSTSSPVALGVFDVHGSGEQVTQVGSDARGYAGFTSFAISQEPGHTPPASPSKVLAIGQA